MLRHGESGSADAPSALLLVAPYPKGLLSAIAGAAYRGIRLAVNGFNTAAGRLLVAGTDRWLPAMLLLLLFRLRVGAGCTPFVVVAGNSGAPASMSMGAAPRLPLPAATAGDVDPKERRGLPLAPRSACAAASLGVRQGMKSAKLGSRFIDGSWLCARCKEPARQSRAPERPLPIRLVGSSVADSEDTESAVCVSAPPRSPLVEGALYEAVLRSGTVSVAITSGASLRRTGRRGWTRYRCACRARSSPSLPNDACGNKQWTNSGCSRNRCDRTCCEPPRVF